MTRKGRAETRGKKDEKRRERKRREDKEDERREGKRAEERREWRRGERNTGSSRIGQTKLLPRYLRPTCTHASIHRRERQRDRERERERTSRDDQLERGKNRSSTMARIFATLPPMSTGSHDLVRSCLTVCVVQIRCAVNEQITRLRLCVRLTVVPVNSCTIEPESRGARGKQ